MGAPVVESMGRWAAREAAVEAGIPLLITLAAWWQAWRLLSAPSAGHGASTLELALVFGACGVLSGWSLGRQMYIMGRRRPLPILIPAFTLSVLVAAAMTMRLPGAFAQRCKTELLGETVTLAPLAEGARALAACKIGGVPANNYLPGTLVEPMWSGRPDPAAWAALLLGTLMGGLGLRDRRLRPSRLATRLNDRLWYAPAGGSKGAIGDLGPEEQVIACGNATLWGEPCAQLFGAGHEFVPGEVCPRCQQVFVRCDRALRMTVVSLRESDLQVLNAVERVDTASWDRGGPPPPESRISGQERWAVLGDIELPDVLSVAQALAVVFDRLPRMTAASAPETQAAGKLAVERGSRLAAWIWFGRHAHRLTFARPTHRAVLAVGPRRLRDVVGAGEDLWLQLDIGLLPLELRTAFRRSFLDERRAAVAQNSRSDHWIPTGPPGPTPAGPGVWVPRLEGEALRAWLSTERRPRPGARGVATPLPYLPSGWSSDDSYDAAPLDFALLGWHEETREVLLQPDAGDSIAEWDWFDWQQIELLRQRPLVLVGTAGETPVPPPRESVGELEAADLYSEAAKTAPIELPGPEARSATPASAPSDPDPDGDGRAFGFRED